MSVELKYESAGPDQWRVFIRRGPLEVATYVSDINMVESQRSFLHRTLLRIESEAEVA